MTFALLPPVPVLGSQQARLAADALPEGEVRMCQILSSAGWVDSSYRCMICFCHTFHPLMRQYRSRKFFISASPLPSALIPVLGVGRFCLYCREDSSSQSSLCFLRAFLEDFWSIMEDDMLVHSCSFVNSAFALYLIEKSQKPVIGFALILVCAELNSPWLIIITFQISYLENGNLVNKMKSQPLCF